MIPFEPIENSFASSSTSELDNSYHEQKHASSNNSSSGRLDTETMPIHKQKQGGRTFRYVETILKEWARADVKTLEDVNAFEATKRSLRGSNTVSFPVRQHEDKTAFFENLREEGARS